VCCHLTKEALTMPFRHWITLLLPLWVVLVASECPRESEGGCNYGFCRDEKCLCQPGFTGADCSLKFEICADGDRTCFNGSECIRNNEKDPITRKYKYRCDCGKAFDLSSYAGVQCEHASTSSCEHGVESSPYSFCTNGGTCVREVQNGEPHEGCQCSSDFTGAHCQYRIDDVPPEELKEKIGEYRGPDDGLERWAIFLIVVIVLAVVGLFAYMIVMKKSQKSGIEEPQVVPPEFHVTDKDPVETTTEII